MGVVQSKDGYGALATVEVKIEDAADLAGQATATGNNINIATGGHEAWLSADQTSAGVVTANTTVEVTNWSGTAQAIAYGVGNSTLVTNEGPEIALGMIQNTVAEVTGTANLNGSQRRRRRGGRLGCRQRPDRLRLQHLRRRHRAET